MDCSFACFFSLLSSDIFTLRGVFFLSPFSLVHSLSRTLYLAFALNLIERKEKLRSFILCFLSTFVPSSSPSFSFCMQICTCMLLFRLFIFSLISLLRIKVCQKTHTHTHEKRSSFDRRQQAGNDSS